MSKIKIAFFDIDGTLIDPEKKRITDNTKKALLKLKENGVKICIATGRPPEKVPDFKSEGIDFDAFLTFNGSYSFNETETIFENPLDKEDVKQIIQNAKHRFLGQAVDFRSLRHRAFYKQHVVGG